MKPKRHKESQEGYGVLVTRKDGSAFLASAGKFNRFFHQCRKDAIDYKNELQPHLESQCKVVKVKATLEVMMRRSFNM